MAKYLISIDIGTSGAKSILMDTGGKLIASGLKAYDVLTPPGVGTGCFSYEDVQNRQVFDEPVRHKGEARKIYDRLFKIYKSIYGNLKGDFAELNKL